MDIRDTIFRARGFTPIPFIIVALIWAQPNLFLLVMGLTMGLVGEAIRFHAILHAGSETRTRKVGASKLITTGSYAKTRNPLYYGNLLMYVGYALGSGALLPWFPIVAFIWVIYQYYMIIMLEEETLRKIFGKEYAAYCRKVPRLFPHLFASSGNPVKNYSYKEALHSEKSSMLALAVTWAALVAGLYYLPLVG